MIGIYCIINKVNNKKYIGKSKQLDIRERQHFNRLEKGNHYNNYLQHAYNKYGKENFQFEILEVVSEEKLNERECYYIKKYNTTDSHFGYNLRSGGEGGKMAESSKQKMSIKMRGKNTILTEEDVRRIKLCIYCLMSREEISEIFNVSQKVITQIAIGKNFEYVNEELNFSIHYLKQNLINERNKEIIELHDKGYKNIEITRKTGYSISIIEKTVNKYRNPQEKRRQQRIKIYDEIMDLHEKGYTLTEIHYRTKQPKSTIHHYIMGDRNPHNDLPFKKVTKKVEDNIIKMYFKEGASIKDICKVLCLSDTTVEDYVNRYKYANTEITNKSKNL